MSVYTETHVMVAIIIINYKKRMNNLMIKELFKCTSLYTCM